MRQAVVGCGEQLKKVAHELGQPPHAHRVARCRVVFPLPRGESVLGQHFLVVIAIALRDALLFLVLHNFLQSNRRILSHVDEQDFVCSNDLRLRFHVRESHSQRRPERREQHAYFLKQVGKQVRIHALSRLCQLHCLLLQSLRTEAIGVS